MSGKIPVTVISGFLGSGKTTLLNRLLQPEGGAGKGLGPGTVVLINELGDIGLDHARVLHLSDKVVLLDSGCLCCAVRGELVGALRQLFLDALHKRIPSFSRVIIETTGIADPAPVIYTLRYDHFLAERYLYGGCLAVIDGLNGQTQLLRHPEAVQQAVLADVLLIGKTDLASQKQIHALKQLLGEMNADAPQYDVRSLPEPAQLLLAAEEGRHRSVGQGNGLWSGRTLGAAAPDHVGVDVLTLTWGRPLLRASLMQTLDSLLADESLDLLRMKGRVWFQGQAQPYALHAVHRQLYPLQAMDAAQESSVSVLVLIFRGGDKAAVAARIRAGLPGAAPADDVA